MTPVSQQSIGRNENVAGAHCFHLCSYLKSDIFEGRNGMTCGSWVLTKECSNVNFP